MKFVLSIAWALAASTVCLGGSKGEYAANTIPEDLKQAADAVVRRSSTRIDIISYSEVRMYEKHVITILNEKGKKFADIIESSDKLNEVKVIKGRLLDAEGNTISHIKKNDVKERASSGGNFIDDNQVKYYRFTYAIYPFTVEYEVERVIHHTFGIPRWCPVSTYNTSVENARLEVTYPASATVRHKALKLENPQITTGANLTVLSDSIVSFRAVPPPPPMLPKNAPFFPQLLLTTENFELDGMKGSLRNWNDFGKFYFELNARRQQLPDSKKADVHRLTDTCGSTISKINALYNYLQQETRYVSIQLGIGGWQTAEASTVASRGYGDCKALSNYMMSLLQEAGIESHVVLVNAGESNDPTLGDFAYNAFNHAILMVPSDGNSIWIECTSKNLQAGYLSSFTDDREVLEITPVGGIIRKTPVNSQESNTLARKVELVETGNTISYHITENHGGIWWEREQEIINESEEPKEVYLNRKYRIPTYSVDSFSMATVWRPNPVTQEKVEISAPAATAEGATRQFARYDIFRPALKITGSI